jgi:hypothetical protein
MTLLSLDRTEGDGRKACGSESSAAEGRGCQFESGSREATSRDSVERTVKKNVGECGFVQYWTCGLCNHVVYFARLSLL